MVVLIAHGEGQVEDHDGELISESIRRPEMFEVIFDRYYQILVRYAVGRVGHSDAPDVASEALVRAFTRRSRFDTTQATALPWLFGIAANVCRERRRKTMRGFRAIGRMATPPLGVSPFEADAVDRIDASAAAGELASALEELSEDEYQVLMLAAIGDLSYNDIASSLRIPIGTVRSRLARSKRRMRELLEPVRPILDGDEQPERVL